MIQIVTERNRPIAWQASPFMRWRMNMAGADVWVDCMSCDLSIGARSTDGREISDKEFIKAVKSLGWVVKPGTQILCPECKEKHNEPMERARVL